VLRVQMGGQAPGGALRALPNLDGLDGTESGPAPENAAIRTLTASPEISVVVPVRDGERHIGGFLEAVEMQTLARERFETIVVDDGSRDATRELARAWVDQDGDRRKLAISNGGGPGYARNIGWRLAKGNWIAFADSDTIPRTDWLDAALAAVRSTGTDAVEGSVEPWPAEAVGPYTHQPRNETGGYYMTANMIYRRELLERLGGFDERFEQFLEDSDLAFRAMESGVEIPFRPEVRVHHRVIERSVIDVLRSTRRLRWIPLLAAVHPERYRSQLRPHVRPLGAVDVDVVFGLLSIVAARRAHGIARLVLMAGGANGLRRGIDAGQVRAAPPRKATKRAVLAVALPVCRVFWWIEGSLRFRKLVW
jgi:GT2 family glycosyltransferase